MGKRENTPPNPRWVIPDKELGIIAILIEEYLNAKGFLEKALTFNRLEKYISKLKRRCRVEVPRE